MKYFIEGIITEIKVSKSDYKFRIFGLEGYSLKLNKKKYNVLCPNCVFEDAETEERTYIYAPAIIFSQDQYLSIKDKVQKQLIQTNSLGKHVKIELAIDEEKILSEIKTISDFSIESLTLLLD